MTWASPHPGAAALAAVSPSDVVVALLVAVGVWLAGWALVLGVTRSRRPSARLRSLPSGAISSTLDEAPRALEPVTAAGRSPDPPIGDVVGVLRWLISETEAEAAAFLRLAPGGAERLVVEPRGLEPAFVAGIARTAREALVRPSGSMPSGYSIARWLGAGGSKVVVLRGVSGAGEPLRFARFALEWVGASRGDPALERVEERVLSVPGVAWAEISEEDPPRIRVLLADGVDRAMVREAVEGLGAASGVEIGWLDQAEQREAPRARLVDVVIELDAECSAVVYLDWRGQELRGRGQAGTSESGRHRAAAQAMADALRPLLADEIRVEALYSHAHDNADLLMVVVSVDGDSLVGAVRSRPGDRDATAARAVLDALNRRLDRIAGGSGRI